MRRFFLALVCAAMFFNTAFAEQKRLYVHWTLRLFDGGIVLDRPWVVDDDASGTNVCESRGIPREQCISTSNDASSCASVVTYSYVGSDGKRQFSFNESSWPAKRNREFVQNALGKIFKDVQVIDSDERCGGDQTKPSPPGDKTPRS